MKNGKDNKWEHSDNCLWATPLPTGMGYWHCTCGFSDYEYMSEENAALRAENERLRREKGLLVALYERHKHLDTFLSDETFPPIGRTGSAILYELWKFVKEAAIDGGALGSGDDE